MSSRPLLARICDRCDERFMPSSRGTKICKICHKKFLHDRKMKIKKVYAEKKRMQLEENAEET